MPLLFVQDLDDPRVAPFRDLPRTSAHGSGGSTFIAEGERLLRRMLHAGIQPEAVLLEPERIKRLADLLPEQTELLVCPRELLRQIVGFRFHRGLLALARRPAIPNLRDWPSRLPADATLVVCDGIQDPENLGSILRSAAAFGVRGVLLGKPRSDPFSRRVLRVSIGAAFRLPVFFSEDLVQDLVHLRRAAGFQVIASVLEESAEPLGNLACEQAGPLRRALVLGSEADGIRAPVLAACDRRVTIPLPGGIDSLNVSVAAGILLHGLVESPRI